MKDPDKKVLAKRTDEGLEIIQRLHTGEAVDFSGEIYNVRGARLLPRPDQRPRIPVWVGAMLPAKPGQRRAARWDGIMPHVMPAMLEESQDTTGVDMRVLMQPTPEQIGEVVEFSAALRETEDPFDVVVSGITAGLDKESASKVLSEYESVGGTWWLEWLDCGSLIH